jgi:hypothetical protein
LCKPPNWSKIEEPVWRFKYAKNQCRKGSEETKKERDSRNTGRARRQRYGRRPGIIQGSDRDIP